MNLSLLTSLLTPFAGFWSLVQGLVLVLFVISGLLLTLVVLLQEGKGGGIAGAFGGAGAEAFGVKAGTVNRFTAWVAGFFLLLALLHVGLKAWFAQPADLEKRLSVPVGGSSETPGGTPPPAEPAINGVPVPGQPPAGGAPPPTPDPAVPPGDAPKPPEPAPSPVPAEPRPPEPAPAPVPDTPKPPEPAPPEPAPAEPAPEPALQPPAPAPPAMEG